jgi:hypothetical protein
MRTVIDPNEMRPFSPDEIDQMQKAFKTACNVIIAGHANGNALLAFETKDMIAFE